jgi:predicted MFS family arabinose efflux permease
VAFRALAHRDFRLFWASQCLSLVGTWMQSLGQAWLVLHLTASPFKLGAINALQFLPLLCFGVLGGVISDRLPKRRLIVATQAALALQALALAVLTWTGHVRYWHVAVLALLFGSINTLDLPARQAFLVELCGKDHLTNAIALNSAAFNAARIVGPAIAGLVIARFGEGPAFFLNGLSFVPVICALLAVRAEGRPREGAGTTVLQELREGLGYARHTPLVAFILGLVVMVSVFTLNHGVLVPLLAKDVLQEAAQGLGFLMSALGAGALSGALAVVFLGRDRPRLAAIVAPALGLSAGMLALAAVHRFWHVAAVLFVVGLCQILFMTGCNATLQMTAPDALRGRTMSLYTLAFAGVAPVGASFIGGAAELYGVTAACVAAGSLALLAVLVLTWWWERRTATHVWQA